LEKLYVSINEKTITGNPVANEKIEGINIPSENLRARGINIPKNNTALIGQKPRANNIPNGNAPK
jgi:hypothetical protein